MNSEEQFSVIISEALDVLGYNRDIVTARRWAYDNFSKVITEEIRNTNPEHYVTISGSKREGLAGLFQSDTDVMTTGTDVQCSDDPASVTRDVGYIFELDREGCPHGYTKLRLFYRNVSKMKDSIENSLIQYPDGSCYLSNALFISEFQTDPNKQSPMSRLFNTHDEPRSGPSLPTTGQNPFCGISINSDNVDAFPCQCSDYLRSWINRPRDFDWPSRGQIETASTLDAHVVPVGAKGSEEAHLQWRICYTLTEVDLMQSLNETKWKLYVTLKTIRDLVFKPLGDLLTSYVLKNVIMWISESNPIDEFQPKYILHKLRQCLDFLIRGFCDKKIPNYMISDRNLLQGRLNDHNTREHLAALNQVRKNLPATILRCTQLKDAMVQVYVAPGYANTQMRFRNEIETSALYSVSLAPYSSIRFDLCSSLQELWDAIIQLVLDHAGVFAAACNIPVDAFVYIFQLIKMCPPEIRLNCMQYCANLAYPNLV